jgi:hypothetical protein
LDVFQEPKRIFSGDESGFQLCPKAGKFLACKGGKNVCELDGSPAKVSVTAMFTFSAGGLMLPPMVIYPYERILSGITKTISDDWGVGHSTTGRMTAEVFLNILDMFSLHTLENIMSISLLSFLSIGIAPI